MVTAESMTIQQRQVIEKVFGCKVANEYGCSETGGFVYECPNGSWHISSELVFVEFLDTNGRPVSPGEKGETGEQGPSQQDSRKDYEEGRRRLRRA